MKGFKAVSETLRRSLVGIECMNFAVGAPQAAPLQVLAISIRSPFDRTGCSSKLLSIAKNADFYIGCG
jgi:hypothetical protein